MFCNSLEERPDSPIAQASPGLRPLLHAKTLTPQLLAAAQSQYDEWDESDEDTYAGGGICHLIADALVEVLAAAGFEVSAVCSSQEQHVYVVCQLSDGIHILDIPPSIYELGSTYTWTKIKGVQFDATCLTWLNVDSDPTHYHQFID